MDPAATCTDDYHIGIITALYIERAAIRAMLDEEYGKPDDFKQSFHDPNNYTWGRISGHYVVIASLAGGVYGTTMATTTALPMLYSFNNLKFGFMVGIGAGVPNFRDIRLGDVVVSQPSGTSGGVIQYDLGKAKNKEWERKDFLSRPPEILLKALTSLQASHEFSPSKAHDHLNSAITKHAHWGQKYSRPSVDDCLFVSSYPHQNSSVRDTCSACDLEKISPRAERSPGSGFEIHYGTIASGNSLVKDVTVRDWIASMDSQCLCIEMEAAGIMNNFPCLVIRGICDYADSHKNDAWQRYACATAASFCKELLSFVPLTDSKNAAKATEILQAHESHHVSIRHHVSDASDSAEQPASPSELPSLRSITSRATIAPDSIQTESVSGSSLDNPTTTGLLVTNPKERAPIDFNMQTLLAEVTADATSKEENETPLHHFARKGNLAALYFLLDHGYDLEAADSFNKTPLFTAARFGHVDVVKLLVEHNANIEAANKNGSRPLFIAAQEGHLDVVKLLIEHNANIEARNKKSATPLYIAVECDNIDVAKLLIEHNANIEAANENGATPLYLAAQEGRLDVVKLLIEHNANIEAANKNGATPLYLAAQKGHLDTVKFLIEHNANIEGIRKDGATPLYIAAHNGHLDTVKFLIEHNANIEGIRKDGATPLYIAAHNGHLDVVTFLLNSGANVRGASGHYRPVDAARHYGHDQIVKLLRKKKWVPW